MTDTKEAAREIAHQIEERFARVLSETGDRSEALAARSQALQAVPPAMIPDVLDAIFPPQERPQGFKLPE